MALLPGSINDIEDRSPNEEKNEQAKLIFPINVHESMQASSGLKKSEKVGIMVGFWVFGCAVLGWFLLGWLRTIIPGAYGWVTLLVEIVLQLTVGVYILRFAMDERAVFQEMNNSDQSFANFFKIYREIVSEDGSKYPFDIIEFDDGSYGVFIQCRLGHNTQRRSDATYEAHKAVDAVLNKAGLPRKIFYHNEIFKSSQAAQDLRDSLKKIEDPVLFNSYREIIQNYLSITDDEANVLCVTYLVYATNRIAKDELIATMHNVFNMLERDETVYREITAMRYDEIVEFLRHYYQLEILDMGIIRAHVAAKKATFNCTVSVLKIYGDSGKIYTSEEFKKLNDEVLKQFGLDSVN